MCKRLPSTLEVAAITATLAVLSATLPTIRAMLAGAALAPAAESAESAEAAEAAPITEPAAPQGQTYVGSKVCASCHFKQLLSWKATKHADAFKLLPEKYRTDATCLKCHTTGYGAPGGFKDIESTPALAGNSCEMCHGPGSKHAEICEAFSTTLTAAQEEAARDSIWKIIPTNICIECHLTKAHLDSATPKELRDE